MEKIQITKTGTVIRYGVKLSAMSIFGKTVIDKLPEDGIFIKAKELKTIFRYHKCDVRWDFSTEPPIGLQVISNGKLIDVIPLVRNINTIREKKARKIPSSPDRHQNVISHKIIQGTFVPSGHVRIDKDDCTLSDRTISIVYDTKAIFGARNTAKIPVTGLHISIANWAYIVSNPDRFGKWKIIKVNPGRWVIQDQDVKFDLVQL